MNWANLEWPVLFIVSWAMFFFLVNFKELGKNIWSGLTAVVLQLLIDSHSVHHNFYHFDRFFFPFHLFESPILFAFGPILVIGILIAQFHPRKRAFRIINVSVLSVLFYFIEYLLIKRNALIYTNWHYTDSLYVNILAMVFLSWFSLIILGKDRKAH